MLTSSTGASLKRLVVTRWSASGEAVRMVKTQFTKILESLEILTAGTASFSIGNCTRKAKALRGFLETSR